MSSLENLQINDTFPGLIKTNDEAAVDGTLRTLQDGAGNNLPIEVSTTGVNFTGTVTGIPASGGATPAMSFDQLPPWGATGAGRAWFSWVPVPSYTLASYNTSPSLAETAIFPIAEGESISAVQYSVSVGTTGNVNAAFYFIEKNANGDLLIGEKAFDLGTIPATLGVKEITLGAPYVFPGGQPYGALAFLVAFTDTGGSFSCWNTSQVWPSQTGFDYGDTTIYRTVKLQTTGLVAGELPANGTALGYGGQTSHPLWAFISKPI